MKKISLLLIAFLAFVINANASVIIGSKTYSVDTLLHRQIGPGIKHTRIRIPDYPLNVYLLEVDMTNPYNRVETTQAKNMLGSTEKLEDAYKRHQSMGKKPIAACNASFWCVSSQIPWYNFMPGVPHGAEVVNDTIYVNTNRNGVYDFNGGTVNTASTIITKDGRALVGRHEWYGCAKSSKFSKDQEIIQVNKCMDHNQLVLFNHARGRNREFFSYVQNCHYVFLKLKEGSKWSVAKDIEFEVAEIKLSANNQVLGNYDACLIADGSYKTEIEKLAVGDNLSINTYWFDIDGDRSPIEVENMTEGEAHVMLKGEITNRATADYGSKVYSRTAYGCNKDGSKLYMIVIDLSTHPEYGKSIGCTATVMCQLWKSLVPDLWNVANMDAGGSAQMLVDGSVINYTTEGVPRAVANGMMLFSTAPNEDSEEIAELRFVETNHRTAVMSSYAPKVLGYNKYGELISEDVPVTYTCSENIGTPKPDGSAIYVGSVAGIGTITAHYGAAEVTTTLSVVSETFGVRLKSIVIDNVREYPMEVVTTLDGVEQLCDASRFAWSIEDESIASLENCILKGLKEGSTAITVSLGDYTETVPVKVEIAKEEKVYQTWDGWTMSSYKLSGDATLTADGIISFAYAGTTGAYFSMEKDVVFYSLPDRLYIDFTATTPIQKVEMDIRSNLTLNKTDVPVVKLPESGRFKKETRYTIDIMPFIGDVKDMSIYPIILREILFYPFRTGYTAGENTVTIHGLWAEYDNHTSGVKENFTENRSSISVYPNIVTDGRFMVSANDAEQLNVAIYNMSGALLYNNDVNVEGGSVVISPKIAAGMYLVKVTDGDDVEVCKMIIK